MTQVTRRQVIFGAAVAGLSACFARYFLKPSLSTDSSPGVRPLIMGIAHPQLNRWTQDLLGTVRPAGIILYGKNIVSPTQLSALTDALRSAIGRDVLIVIDQEGGPVSRLTPPEWHAYPAPSELGKIALRSDTDGRRAVYLNYRLMAYDVAACGINTNAAPVLDRFHPGYQNDSYSYRSFGDNGALIAELGMIACQATLEGGVLPVIKHMPGQGCVVEDVEKNRAHIALPLPQLKEDYGVFKSFSDMPLGMTSLVTFDALDSLPVSLSKPAVAWIRHGLGFKGLLMSDDLGVASVEEMGFTDKNRQALEAGIDLCLYSKPITYFYSLESDLSHWPAHNLELYGRMQAALALAKQSFKPCNADACRTELSQLLNRYGVSG